MNVPRWLRGHAYASPHSKSWVRVQVKGLNVRAEVYVPLSNARELRDSLDQILKAVSR